MQKRFSSLFFRSEMELFSFFMDIRISVEQWSNILKQLEAPTLLIVWSPPMSFDDF